MLYNNEIEKITPYEFNKEFKVSQMLGITFPKSKFDIAGNYNADIQNFYNIYSKLDGEEFISELGFILKMLHKSFTLYLFSSKKTPSLLFILHNYYIRPSI